jgi:hypothetical protein
MLLHIFYCVVLYLFYFILFWIRMYLKYFWKQVNKKKRKRRSLPTVAAWESFWTGPLFFSPRGGPNRPLALPRTRAGGPARRSCRGPSQSSPQQPLPSS